MEAGHGGRRYSLQVPVPRDKDLREELDLTVRTIRVAVAVVREELEQIRQRRQVGTVGTARRIQSLGHQRRTVEEEAGRTVEVEQATVRAVRVAAAQASETETASLRRIMVEEEAPEGLAWVPRTEAETVTKASSSFVYRSAKILAVQ